MNNRTYNTKFLKKELLKQSNYFKNEKSKGNILGELEHPIINYSFFQYISSFFQHI